MGNARSEADLSAVDWLVAVLSVLLTPLVPLLLALYNFLRGRRKRGVLYLSVCVVAVAIVGMLTLAKL